MKVSPLTALVFNSANFPTFGKLALNAVKGVQKAFPRSNTARKLYHATRNWYEGGWPLWTGGAESYLPSLVQDARWDQNYVTRREMLRRMRYWSQNSAIVEAILSVGERYTVGASGLHVHFYPNDDLSQDTDDSWYERADAVVCEWFGNCGWNGETMQQLLKIGYRDQKVDGEVFYLKTRKAMPLNLKDGLRSRSISVQKPCLQIIEAHRVESPWNQFEQENRTLIDGVQFEKVQIDGREMFKPVGFWARSGASSFEQQDSWHLILKDDIWQMRNVTRADQPRSVSDFYSVEVTINKLEDTLEIEDKAHASQSVRALAIESASGQASSVTDKKIELINSFIGKGVIPAPNEEWCKRQEAYRKETGAYVYGLKTGEKVHFDTPTRPGEQTLNLIELRINFICAGSHSPRCLVLQKISGGSAKSQGTEVRAELDSADKFYKEDCQKWINFTKDAVAWFMEWAVNNDPRVADPPSDWRSCLHVQQPEACNVDVGYTTQSNMMLLAAGVIDYEMFHGPMGVSTMTIFRRLKRQQQWLEKNKVKITLPGLLQGQIPLEAPRPESEDAAHV